MDKAHHAMVIDYALSLSADIIITITLQMYVKMIYDKMNG